MIAKDLVDVVVTDELRDVIRGELSPELNEITDVELRDLVVEAWATAIAHSSFNAISELRASGVWHSDRLKNGTQADHLRGVTATAMGMADAMMVQFPEIPLDRDIMIAGSLCHDVGKPYEFDPVRMAARKNSPSKAGWPMLRHPPYGVHICLTVGLPEEVAHIAAGHSYEGEVLSRSAACTIVHFADKGYWATMRASDLMVDDYEAE
jgi:putative nucleotidyltransferase with HDIG domain